MTEINFKIDFSKIEEEIVDFWQKNKFFEKSNDNRKNHPIFSFYDGPPFANGLPHYGHLLASTVKDIIGRYWTMRGYYVDRRFGWDCHGLPVEYEIEKSESLKGRNDILNLGIDKFNDMCANSVMKYTGIWQKTITRIGRWVDWNNQYRTMDKDYIESVWWVFSKLYEKNLIYKSYYITPYSPRTGSVVSNFESNQNYKDTLDPSIIVKFNSLDEKNTYYLVWTTTPWTLISNLALAVSKDIEYLKVKDIESGEIYYLAKNLVKSVFKKDRKFEILSNLKGNDLIGMKYKPLFDYFKNNKNSFKILDGEFVSTEEGTGIVHIAPAFGEDDFNICKKNDIKLVDPLTQDCHFKDFVKEFKGLYIKDADKLIIKSLKKRNILFNHCVISHRYPFDERTDTPLIYRSIESWYVNVNLIKDKIIKNNKKINWVPSHIKEGRMGKWLENIKDWAISRNRFWGCPIPIWQCSKNNKHIDLIKSVNELKSKSNVFLKDLHKQHIDNVTYKCKHCDGIMKRIPEVFDCWFESGSMPYAQFHYTFENKELFEKSFPADFITEGLDQTRGWFYTLLVLSSALYDKPAFKNVIVTGLILDKDGKKMSKRKKNYTSPDELIARFGSDSVRLFMINSPVLKGENLIFTNEGVKQTTRSIILPIYNSFVFLDTYSKADNWKPDQNLIDGKIPDTQNIVDQWIISKYHSLLKEVNFVMDKYLLHKAIFKIIKFIDNLTNWYIRVNRRRFWNTSDLNKDNEDAYKTLFYIIWNFIKLLAPFAPFISEYLYSKLKSGLKTSIHLSNIKNHDDNLINHEIEYKMDMIKNIVELARSVRSKHNIKIRQPLYQITIITEFEKDKSVIDDFKNLIKTELNIKNINFSTNYGDYVKLFMKPNFKVLGKKIGKNIKLVQEKLSIINKDQKSILNLKSDLENNEFVKIADFKLDKDDLIFDYSSNNTDNLFSYKSGIMIILDNKLDENLILEGISRDIINSIQKFRKLSKLDISDRIAINIKCTGDILKSVKIFKKNIMEEVLANKLDINQNFNYSYNTDIKINDFKLYLNIEKINKDENSLNNK